MRDNLALPLIGRAPLLKARQDRRILGQGNLHPGAAGWLLRLMTGPLIPKHLEGRFFCFKL